MNTHDAEYPGGHAQYVYDEPVGVVDPHQPHIRRRVSDIRRFRQPPACSLDIGCGKGEVALLLQQSGFIATGLDMKEHCIWHLRQNHPGPRWLNCDLADMIRDGEQFDIITMYHVLEHISQPLQFLQFVQQLCAPGALVVIEVPNVGGLEARLKGSRWHYYKVDHVNYFRARDLVNLAKSMDWRIRALRGFQHFSYPQNVWWKDAIKGVAARIGFQDVVSLFLQVPACPHFSS